MDRESISMHIGLKNEIIFGKDNPFFVPEPIKWNRYEFYSRPTSLCKYNDANISINLDYNSPKISKLSLDFVEGQSGIWSLWGKKSDKSISSCLDVHETLDVGYEIRMHEKDLDFARKTDWNDKIYTANNNFSLQKRSKAIVQWLSLDYRVVCLNIAGKINREAIEAQYAWNNKAIYWNRNYFQPVTIETLNLQRKNEYILSLR